MNPVLVTARRNLRMVFTIFALVIMNEVSEAAGLPASMPFGGASTFSSQLETVRRKYNLPAMAAAAVIDGKIVWHDVSGFRKAGTNVRVGPLDQFHVGSISKSMTGTLLGALVERGMMRWDMTLGEVFPELRSKMQPEYRNVTLLMLVTHHAGFPGNKSKAYDALNWFNVPGTPTQLRYKYLAMELGYPPASPPGTQFAYSFGFELAAAMAERVTQMTYEDLMRKYLFVPLEMQSAGFGPPGTKGKIDQPWQHMPKDGQVIPLEPDPHNDNYIVGRAGGAVHCSILDLAKYLQAHATGETGGSSLLKSQAFQFLHEVHFKGQQKISSNVSDNYAVGWFVTSDKANAGGQMLWHNGTNLKNFAVCWVAPKRKRAFCVITNQGGDDAGKACNEMLSYLVEWK